jgi:hypothetical protein
VVALARPELLPEINAIAVIACAAHAQKRNSLVL